jgi:hypothetical protein
MVLAGLALGIALVPGTARAQGITLTPYIGSYYGLSKFFDSDIDLSVFGGSGTARFTMEQTNTVMFGARISEPLVATLSISAAGG